MWDASGPQDTNQSGAPPMLEEPGPPVADNCREHTQMDDIIARIRCPQSASKSDMTQGGKSPLAEEKRDQFCQWAKDMMDIQDGVRNGVLDSEQAKAIAKACQKMMRKEQSHVDNRQHNISMNSQVESESEIPKKGSGFYIRKGKGIDPGNWGDIELPEDEVDPKTQGQLFEKFQAQNARDNENWESEDDTSTGNHPKTRKLNIPTMNSEKARLPLI